MSASVLDLTGGVQARRAATLLIGAVERRIGAVHAVGTDTATLLFLGSLVARLRGRHARGTGLGLAGNVAAAGAGFLGGHLALNRGTARRNPHMG